jgi:hypothetical protein
MLYIDIVRPIERMSEAERHAYADELEKMATRLREQRTFGSTKLVVASRAWPTIDDVTPEEWRHWTQYERNEFNAYWRVQGSVSFCCLGCGYPTAHGQSRCVACPSREGA